MQKMLILTSDVPKITAKIEDKMPNVNANGAASTIAWVFKS